MSSRMILRNSFILFSFLVFVRFPLLDSNICRIFVNE
nr:MAG TPA: hypothetical protein [Caudoviricetes sp.]